jgi:tetratricopeptide (TPR) repeat protein
MKTTGKVSFPVTTDEPLVQSFINQGVGQLHGFWYFEAERSFRQAAAIDPNCAVAYWGMAMANPRWERRARGFIAKASEHKSGITRRESMWIESLASYYLAGPERDKERRAKLVADLENISREFPDDLEARAFLVWKIWENIHRGIRISDYEKADRLISSVLDVEPEHPIHHYRLRLWERKDARRGLESAARCGQASPGIGILWHAPGRIYSRLHRYSDAAWHQEASARVHHAQIVRDRVLPDRIHYYSHNNEWLVRNLSHVGRVRDAIDMAKNMLEVPRHPNYNNLNKWGCSAFWGRIRLRELLLRYELWGELEDLSRTLLKPVPDIYAEYIPTLHAIGLAYFHQGKVDEGRKFIEQMEALRKEFQASSNVAVKAAEETAHSEEKEEADVKLAKFQAARRFGKKLAMLTRGLNELKVLDALAAGDKELALKHVADPRHLARDRLSRIYLEAGDGKKAKKFALSVVNPAGPQVQPLANAVDILYRLGEHEESFKYFRTLQKNSAFIDLDIPVFQRIAPVAKALKFRKDWRAKKETPKDIGDRPSLDRLGPFRWQPYRAEPWKLTGVDGRSHSLRSYRGRNIIVIVLPR